LNAEKLKKAAAEILPNVDMIIGCRQGFDALHAEACFITKPEEIETLILNPLCEYNLAAYLPANKKKKTAVVVKGCDSRTIAQFLQEGLIDRENVRIIGVPCKGVVSTKKVMRAVDFQPVESVAFDGDSMIVKTSKGEKKLALSEVSPDKCKTCQYPTPVVYDVLVGDAVQSDKDPASVYDDIREIEGKSLEERKAYWEKEISRCTRCYACRNACPLCVCQDSCIAETRDPHWQSQKSSPGEKMMFHLIHAIHLAGRCTECGECERACPMNIPLGKLKKKINMDMKELYGYVPGVNPEDKPPLYTFKVEEEKIEEHEL
jgi:formate dehydrogenase (coenzyme F420) beta subunit